MLRAPAYVPDILEDGALTIYVDGSHKPAPRRGGIGIRFVWVNDHGDEEFLDESLPATMGATINQMELEGPSAALELADRGRLSVPPSRFKKIIIRSDSRYVCDNLNNAKYIWPRFAFGSGRYVLSASRASFAAPRVRCRSTYHEFTFALSVVSFR